MSWRTMTAALDGFGGAETTGFQSFGTAAMIPDFAATWKRADWRSFLSPGSNRTCRLRGSGMFAPKDMPIDGNHATASFSEGLPDFTSSMAAVTCDMSAAPMKTALRSLSVRTERVSRASMSGTLVTMIVTGVSGGRLVTTRTRPWRSMDAITFESGALVKFRVIRPSGQSIQMVAAMANRMTSPAKTERLFQLIRIQHPHCLEVARKFDRGAGGRDDDCVMPTPKISPELHQEKKPDWIKVRLPNNPVFFSTKDLVSDLRLHTVCESAQCPNRWECWSGGTATFMIAGERCTRACGFCAVDTAKPLPLEQDEPQRVAEGVKRLGLKHVVITAVARDDIADGGADHFGRTIEAIRALDPKIAIEVLVPDFNGKDAPIRRVLDARPDIFNHNLETVERLTPLVRSRAKYRLSLAVLRRVREMEPEMMTKSGIMLGLGETENELFQSMDDLREAGVTVLTLGQYLRPTPNHLPVVEFVSPETFGLYGEIARKKGFTFVASAPLVRSSYHAGEFNPVETKLEV